MALALAVSILVLSAGAGLGRGLRKLWRAGDEPTSEAVVIDSALGLGAISLAFFFLSAVQLLRGATIVVVLAAGIVLLVTALCRSHMPRREARGRCVTATGVVGGVLLAAVGCVTLVAALAPPSMDDWDSLAYHLAIPKLYLEHGGFHYVDFASHSNFPFLMEMLYLPGLAIGDAVAAKLMHFWMGVLLVAGTAMLVRRHFHANGTPLAAVAIASAPIVQWEATTGYVDLATALYTVLAVHFLLTYLDSRDRPYLIGCSIAAGFAASTKMTALVLVPTLALWLLSDRLARERRACWKPALALMGVAALVCSPWYVKSFIYTGNPVYPFLYSIFGGKDWDSALAANYAAQQAKFGCGHSFVDFLLVPYNLLVKSYAFYDTAGLFVGPIMLVGFVMALLLIQRRSAKTIGLVLFIFAQVLAWFLLTQQSRYLIPVFALLAVFVAAVAYQDGKQRLLQGTLLAVFAATAIFGATTILPLARDRAAVAIGRESVDRYLRRTLDIYQAERWINEELSGAKKVALFGDTRGYYLDCDYVWADPGHNLAFTRDFASAGELADYLKSKGITHALANFRFFPLRHRATGTGAAVYAAIDLGLFEMVYPVDGGQASVGVYRVR